MEMPHIMQANFVNASIHFAVPPRIGLPIRQLAERAIVEHPMTKTGTVEKRKDGVVCTHLISSHRKYFFAVKANPWKSGCKCTTLFRKSGHGERFI